jgi:hypothetical protein
MELRGMFIGKGKRFAARQWAGKLHTELGIYHPGWVSPFLPLVITLK